MCGLPLYLFLIQAFLVQGYSKWLFCIPAARFILSSVETLALQLIRSQIDETAGSLLFLYVGEDHLLRRFVCYLP